ncbi:DJ-1/PfpI family protein [Tistrella bauzanensis]|uniref:DJ-1/PfpI family protein n=2 Tax=Tistrella TaxID=171436 RepID=UPI0035580095
MMTDIPAPSRAGLLIFPGITALDMVGPWEVFLRIPGWAPLLIGLDDQPVAADGGLMLTPHATIADCPPLDLLLIPGGGGIDALLADDAVLDFVRAQAASTAHGIASVCTGALLLGAAGLLRGTRATTHWASHDLLAIFGAIPVADRVVVDGRIASGGGVTAGIDIAVALAARIAGPDVAAGIELAIEYAPEPPMGAGRPDMAPPAVLNAVTTAFADRIARRRALAEAAAARFAAG